MTKQPRRRTAFAMVALLGVAAPLTAGCALEHSSSARRAGLSHVAVALGSSFTPITVQNPGTPPENIKPPSLGD